MAHPSETLSRSPGARAADVALLTRDTLVKLLLGIVEETTGYPRDMVGLDQNLEADLGIDSIKRSEIVAALLQLLPIDHREALADKRGKLNTQASLNGILGLIVQSGESGTANAIRRAGPPARAVAASRFADESEAVTDRRLAADAEVPLDTVYADLSGPAVQCPAPLEIDDNPPMTDPVSRPKLDARFDALRADARADAQGLKAEVAELRGDLKAGTAEVRADLHKMDASIKTWMVATMVGLFIGFGGLFLAMSNALKPAPQSVNATPT